LRKSLIGDKFEKHVKYKKKVLTISRYIKWSYFLLIKLLILLILEYDLLLLLSLLSLLLLSTCVFSFAINKENAINKETLDLFRTIYFYIKQQDFIQRTDSHK